MKPSKMAKLSNSRWQNSKERPNRSINNGNQFFRRPKKNTMECAMKPSYMASFDPQTMEIWPNKIQIDPQTTDKWTKKLNVP